MIGPATENHHLALLLRSESLSLREECLQLVEEHRDCLAAFTSRGSDLEFLNHSNRNVQLTHPDVRDTVASKVIEKGLRTGLRWDRRYGGAPATRVRDHDSERRDKPMIPTITALVSSRGADSV